MASKLSKAQAAVIHEMQFFDTVKYHTLNRLNNGFFSIKMFSGLSISTIKALGEKGAIRFNPNSAFQFALSEATADLQPAAAPTSQPQTVIPAGEAALDDVVLRITDAFGFPLAHIERTYERGDKWFADVTLISSDGDELSSYGFQRLDAIAWAECDDVYPADRQPATSEPAADVLDGDEIVALVELQPSMVRWFRASQENNGMGLRRWHDTMESLKAKGLVYLSGNEYRYTKAGRATLSAYRPQSPVAGQPAESETTGEPKALNGADCVWCSDRTMWLETSDRVYIREIPTQSVMFHVIQQYIQSWHSEPNGSGTLYMRNAPKNELAEKDAEIRRLQAELADARELATQRTEAMQTAQRERDTEFQRAEFWKSVYEDAQTTVKRIIGNPDELGPIEALTRIYEIKREIVKELPPTARIIPATATRPPEPADNEYQADLTALVTGLPDEQAAYVEYEARFRQLDDHLYSADDVRRKMDDDEVELTTAEWALLAFVDTFSFKTSEVIQSYGHEIVGLITLEDSGYVAEDEHQQWFVTPDGRTALEAHRQGC